MPGVQLVENECPLAFPLSFVIMHGWCLGIFYLFIFLMS